MKRTDISGKRGLSDDVVLERAVQDFHELMISLLTKEAEKLSYSISQLELMRFIAERGRPTMKEIAMHLKVRPPSVTALIENLLKKKLVRRAFDPADRRAVRVILTPKALKLFSSFKAIKLKLFKRLLRSLKAEEKKQLIMILSTLTSNRNK